MGMKGYKGFEPGLICRGKQYQENTVFEEENAEICKNGMHFCENPFDVLDHYAFVDDQGEINDFAEVEALDDVKTDDNKKFCTKKLKIGAKIGISGLINAFVEFTLSKIKKESAATNTGYQSAATVEGKESFAIALGVDGKARGRIGCYITCAEWVWNDSEHRYVLKDCRTILVDGERIKEDVYYCLKNGEFVEVDNEAD